MKWAVQIFLVAVTLVVGQAQPGNDAFTDQVNLGGTNFAVEGTVNGATLEEGETHEYSDERSVWYRWSAPSDGLVHLSGSGSVSGDVLPADHGGVCGGSVDKSDGGGDER